MQRKGRRPGPEGPSRQPGLDFEDDNYEAEFTLPRYQQRLLLPRTLAFVTDAAIVFGFFLFFVAATISDLRNGGDLDRAIFGIYGAAYLLLLVVYFVLFMLSTSQTTGMRMQRLIAVDRRGYPLQPPAALGRGFGYLISALPVMAGFVWAFVDPEHLSWADRVSGTFIKRV